MMAKRMPLASIKEMEKYMRYHVKSNIQTDVNRQRYYSDLKLVSTDIYTRTVREYEEEQKCRTLDNERQTSRKGFRSKTIHNDGAVMTISHTGQPGHYVFDVDVSFNSGLLLSFLFTKHEVRKSTNQLTFDSKDQTRSPLFKLPKEVRDRIYELALPTGTWEKPANGLFLRDVTEALRTRSGFYFPFRNISLLDSCRQVRVESLATAFRKTEFRLDDIDEAIQFLIAAGRVGRHNVQALEFSWLSNSDRELQWKHAPADHGFYPTLPLLQVEECVSLLNQCDKLRSICLRFDEISVADLSYEKLKDDPGLKQLCLNHKLQSLQILSTEGEPLEQRWFTGWLQERLLVRRGEEHIERSWYDSA